MQLVEQTASVHYIYLVVFLLWLQSHKLKKISGSKHVQLGICVCYDYV